MRMLRFRRQLLLLLVITSAAAILTGGLSAQRSTRDVVNGREAASNEVLVKFSRAEAPDERAQTAAIVDADLDHDKPNGVRRIRSRKYDAATLVNYFLGAPNVEYAEPNYILYATCDAERSVVRQPVGPVQQRQTIGGQAGISGADIDAPAGLGHHHRLARQRRRRHRHRHRLQPSRSRRQRLVGAGAVHGHHRRRDHHLRRRHARLQRHQQHVRSRWTTTTTARTSPGTIGARRQQRRRRRRRELDHQHDGPQVPELERQRLDVGRGRRDRVRDPGEDRVRGTSGANVRVLSNSWGGGGFSQALLNEIKQGEHQRTCCSSPPRATAASNNDASPFYPASYNVANVVSVAATDQPRRAASFSNYGATTVDLGAPGVEHLLDDSERQLRVLQRHVDGDAARVGRGGAGAVGLRLTTAKLKPRS